MEQEGISGLLSCGLLSRAIPLKFVELVIHNIIKRDDVKGFPWELLQVWLQFPEKCVQTLLLGTPQKWGAGYVLNFYTV